MNADIQLSNRITDNSTAIQSLRHDVSKLGTEIDNVGAISAALAGLHPLDWDGSGSKFQISAAAGTYDGKQAMALGGFYHPNRNMLLSLGVSSSFGSDKKTAGNFGVTFRVGKGSHSTVSDDVAERLAAMDQKIAQLESQNQKLASMLTADPSLTQKSSDASANGMTPPPIRKKLDCRNEIANGILLLFLYCCMRILRHASHTASRNYDILNLPRNKKIPTAVSNCSRDFL